MRYNRYNPYNTDNTDATLTLRSLRERSTLPGPEACDGCVHGRAGNININPTANTTPTPIWYVHVHGPNICTYIQEWDTRGYGPRPKEVVLDSTGSLDSFNFLDPKGFHLYRQRLAMVALRYGDAAHPFSSIPVTPTTPYPTSAAATATASEAGGVLSEDQKRGYRAAAEILLEAFQIRYPDLAAQHKAARVDHALKIEVGFARGDLELRRDHAHHPSPPAAPASSQLDQRRVLRTGIGGKQAAGGSGSRGASPNLK